MAIAALAAGRVATAPMITHTMGIDDLPKAFAALALTDQSEQGDGRVLGGSIDSALLGFRHF